VLVQLARVIQDNVRENDIVARYGGEEFTILCPETSLEQAYTLAERLRLTVARHLFLGNRGGGSSLTISIGVTSLWNLNRCQEEKQVDEVVDLLLTSADQALYAAKREGRNRTRRQLHPELYSLPF